MVQLVISKPFDVGTWVRIPLQSRTGFLTKKKCPTSGERLIRQYSTSRLTRKRNGWILLARKTKASTAEGRWMRNPVWPRLVRPQAWHPEYIGWQHNNDPPDWATQGCSEGLGAFWFFFKQCSEGLARHVQIFLQTHTCYWYKNYSTRA